jgi:hypothetical protein
MSDYRISVSAPDGLNSYTPEYRLAEYLEAVLNAAMEDLVEWANLSMKHQATALTKTIRGTS